ncbi:MAG: Holliday junction branch migration protein RuvA [Pseudomonadota bacterium]
MIAKLTGVIDSLGDDWALIDVGGVGYQLACSASTLRALGSVGEPASAYVETFIRDDRMQLYGFAETGERDWFRTLLNVQGVGARVALAILSALTADELTQAILAQDKTAVARAQGVGPKLAQRVVAELKDKVGEIGMGPGAALAPVPAGETGPDADAVSALINLGYGRSEAFGAVAAARKTLGDKAAVETLIRDGLKELAR